MTVSQAERPKLWKVSFRLRPQTATDTVRCSRNPLCICLIDGSVFPLTSTPVHLTTSESNPTPLNSYCLPMWVLSTDRAELYFFVSPEDVPGGYAILSHVWDPSEQTFQDLWSFRAECAIAGGNPRDHVCTKLRECCILAESHGYRWVWVDTCCIDKTSSSELSEAINSMYRYYGLAEVCYAYIKDVPNGTILSSKDSAFRQSRWHTRGWTLQELLAPDIVIFLFKDWKVLGTKGALAGLLEEITLIPVSVLRLEEELSDVSVSRRMSWAAKRKTTRPEDEAYCLMGIFGINMPTLYGEGRQAFRRLQEEILKRSIDTSLFAWGMCCVVPYLPPPTSESSSPRHIHDDKSCLLAATPSAFASCNQISFNASRDPMVRPSRPVSPATDTEVFSDALDSVQPGLPTFAVTPYGLRAHVMLFESSSYSIVILCCTNKDGRALGLFLTPCPTAPDLLRPLYHPGVDRYRTVTLGNDLSEWHFNGELLMAEWKVIYIVHQPPQDAGAGPRLLVNRSLSTPFRFCKEQLERLLRQHLWSLETLTRTDFSWDGSTPVTLAFKHKINEDAVMILSLGRCHSPYRVDETAGEPHWATLQFYTGKPPSSAPDHACPGDHICEWTDRTRTFKQPMPFYGLMTFSHDITLSFTTCPMNPSTTLVVNIS